MKPSLMRNIKISFKFNAEKMTVGIYIAFKYPTLHISR